MKRITPDGGLNGDTRKNKRRRTEERQDTNENDGDIHISPTTMRMIHHHGVNITNKCKLNESSLTIRTALLKKSIRIHDLKTFRSLIYYHIPSHVAYDILTYAVNVGAMDRIQRGKYVELILLKCNDICVRHKCNAYSMAVRSGQCLIQQLFMDSCVPEMHPEMMAIIMMMHDRMLHISIDMYNIESVRQALQCHPYIDLSMLIVIISTSIKDHKQCLLPLFRDCAKRRGLSLESHKERLTVLCREYVNDDAIKILFPEE